MPQTDGHRPTLVYFGSRHSIPAEVCWGCSDERAGKWVPVTHCAEAAALMGEPGDPSAMSTLDVVHLDRNDEGYGVAS